MKRQVIFTDLDGTLLNDKYGFESARYALDVLKEQDIPLVLVSSKTRAEIEVYRRKLGNEHPFISENGGGIFIPVNYFFGENLKKDYRVIKLGIPYEKLVKVLRKIGSEVSVKGFSDMSVGELVRDSGLSLKEARLAKKREYDEAFVLRHKADEEMLFRLIRKQGLNYTKGGRYYHILGDNDKGKAVRILIDFYKKKFGKVRSVSLGDSKNDLPMLAVTDKSFLIKGPAEWNEKIVRFLKMNKKDVRRAEKLYGESVDILKKFQLGNGAILASSPKGRYPFVYPRDHAICVLGLIEAGLLKRARKGLSFVLKSQNKNGSFPQRLDKKGKDASYKPIQLDNTGLVLYAFAKYVKASGDKSFLSLHRRRVRKSIRYIVSQLGEKNLFFTPNSVHEFPPLERGLEVWANACCYGALKELNEIGVKSKVDLKKVKKAIEKYLWGGKYFVKNIRLKESSSVTKGIDASAYALSEFGVFDDDSEKIVKTVKEIEAKLWHSKLGGICRYEKSVGRNNGGWGPWPHFTLMICKHFIKLGNKKKADEYLRWVLKIACKNMLPEHVALSEDFEEWVDSYGRAGLLRRDREILIKNIRKNDMYLREGVAYSVLPLTWPHAEFIRTWLLYKERFF